MVIAACDSTCGTGGMVLGSGSILCFEPLREAQASCMQAYSEVLYFCTNLAEARYKNMEYGRSICFEPAGAVVTKTARSHFGSQLTPPRLSEAYWLALPALASILRQLSELPLGLCFFRRALPAPRLTVGA